MFILRKLPTPWPHQQKILNAVVCTGSGQGFTCCKPHRSLFPDQKTSALCANCLKGWHKRQLPAPAPFAQTLTRPQPCAWSARTPAKSWADCVRFGFSWSSCCVTSHCDPKQIPWMGRAPPFLPFPLPHAAQHCSSEQRAGLCHRETPLLSSQIYGCPWQADVSLALARGCLRGRLNNSSLRARVSLSKGTLQRELPPAANSHGSPRRTKQPRACAGNVHGDWGSPSHRMANARRNE